VSHDSVNFKLSSDLDQLANVTQVRLNSDIGELVPGGIVRFIHYNGKDALPTSSKDRVRLLVASAKEH